VIQNHKKCIKKLRAKSANFGFQQVPWPCDGLRWTFVRIVLCFSFFVICCAFLVGFSTGRGPNSSSKAPNSEPGWCFIFQAKKCRISLGPTICPIELKMCASYLSDTESEKISKNKSKKCKIWISTSGLTLSWAPLSFCADHVGMFLSLWSVVPS
jgi:hypothetical protein